MSNNYYHFLTPFVPGTKVRSDQVNSELSGIESGFGLLPTNPASMSLGTATLGTDVQGATINDYLVTMPNPRTVNLTGDEVVFQATHTNDAVTAATMDVDGIGAVQLFGTDLSALALGDIVSGEFYAFRFTGSVWQMMNPSRSYLAAAVTASVNAAASAAAALVSEGNAATSETNAAASATSSQDWAIRVEDDPVPVASGGDGITTFSALHWAAKSAATAAANIITGTGVAVPSSGGPYDYDAALIYRNANAVDTANIGFNGTTGELRMANFAYGAPVTLYGTDLAGNLKSILNGDVDGGTLLYYSGTKRFGTGGTGNVGIYSDGNTDTENRWITLYHQNGTERAAFGHLGSSLLIIRNSINGGDIRLQANDAGGVPRVMMLVDPDGPIDIAYAGVTKLSTTSVGINVPETAIIGSNATVDLIDVGNALNIGAADPALGQHIAIDLRNIQSKFNGTLVGSIFINPLGGTVNIGRTSGVTQESINLNVAGFTAVQVQAAGALNIKSSVTNDVTANTIRLMWSNNQIRQEIGMTTGGELRIDNIVNGAGVRLDANDTGGTSRQLFFGDPDGSVSLYYAGSNTFQTITTGVGVSHSTAVSPVIEFNTSTAIRQGFIQFGSPGVIIRNEENGGSIQLQSEDTGGALRTIFNGDPDGGTSLYEAGVKVLETYSSGVRVYHPTSNSPTLAFRDSTAVTLGFINSNASGIVVSNLANGGTVVLESDDAGGTVRTILVGDPDASTNLYYQGLLSLSTISTGVQVRDSSGTTAVLEFDTSSGVRSGFIQFAVNGITIRNEANGGAILLQSEDAGGTLRNILNADPDTNFSIYHLGSSVFRTITGATGGVEVNNALTGGGFERVLTESDKTTVGVTTGPGTYVKTADLSRTNNTVATDNHLTTGTTLDGTARYKFKAFLHFSTASATPDVRVNVNGNTFVGSYFIHGLDQHTTAFGENVLGNGSKTQGVSATFAMDGTNDLFVEIVGECKFTSGAASSRQLGIQWAQNTTNATGLVLKEGSWFEVLKIADI